MIKGQSSIFEKIALKFIGEGSQARRRGQKENTEEGTKEVNESISCLKVGVSSQSGKNGM